MKKSLKHTLLALLGVVIVCFCPGFALAQERRVADVSSAQEFADDVIEITTPVRGVPVQQVFAATWSGATRGQMDAYFRDGTPFPTPVLPRGLPTGMDIRGVGASNWLHPGGDAVFFEAFRGQEERFTSIVDLLRENRNGAFNASVSGTWTFLRPVGTQPVLPLRVPYGIMTLRPDSRQAGVPEGQVRWVVTSYQSVYPTCEGRPAMIYSGSVLTALGRAYLSQRCEHPVDTSSIYTLFGATPPGKLFEVVPRVELRIRLMGRVRIPRSTGYRSPTETAALTIPLADMSDVELEAKPSHELKIIEDALIPACAPGVVSEDLRQAALTTDARVSIAYQHALAREERARTAQAQGELTRTTHELRVATHRGDVNDGRATRHARERNAAWMLIVFMAAIIVWLAVGRKRRGVEASVAKSKLAHFQSNMEKEGAAAASWFAQMALLARTFLGKLDADDPLTSAFVRQSQDALGNAAQDDELTSDLVYSVFQALGMLLDKKVTAPSEPPKAFRLPLIAGLTPEMGEGALAFFCEIVNNLYPPFRADVDQQFRDLRDQLIRLNTKDTAKNWKRLGSEVAAHLNEELRLKGVGDVLRRETVDFLLVLSSRRGSKIDYPSYLETVAKGLSDEEVVRGHGRLKAFVEHEFAKQTAVHSSAKNGRCSVPEPE
ncbi:hypothetical protein KBB27_02565 [Patescibacteria group bacterium]|nr:hypothetical protein [Patescibacteria group bacterium]